ncbi:DUF3817 domain-containing protein [Pendulispora rubella]|uniref:DUF3817 domain-containing protein n=1 Tax=Pendulispora rubella TaxID=2741070 RepID=A0ABZ2L7S1_9BACT
MNTLAWFRAVAFLEGLSLLALLFVAMPLKYLAGMAWIVRIVGSAHGLLFLMFVAMLFQVALERRWALSKGLLAFASSLVPFGTFFLDRALRRERDR